MQKIKLYRNGQLQAICKDHELADILVLYTSIYPDDFISTSKYNWQMLIKIRDKHTCQYCLNSCDHTGYSHHIAPVKSGGLYTLSNGITLCCACHAKAHVGKIAIVINTNTCKLLKAED